MSAAGRGAEASAAQGDAAMTQTVPVDAASSPTAVIDADEAGVDSQSRFFNASFRRSTITSLSWRAPRTRTGRLSSAPSSSRSSAATWTSSSRFASRASVSRPLQASRVPHRTE
jgi:hypothetical protein